MIGPNAAVGVLSDVVAVDMPPRSLNDVLVEIIESQGWETEASSEELLSQDPTNSDDEAILDEQSILNKDTSSEDSDEETIENHKIEDEIIENNEDSIESNEEAKTSVRRLSLFDTLDNQEKKEISENIEKMEPKIEENIDDSIKIDEKNHYLDENKEFSPEESIIEEEFNQDAEDEELLDIPTFLRRQAN